jgi:hypothetical protein
MILSTMQTLVSQGLNEAGSPVFYPNAEITAALNEADRLFCFMTLALETTATWTPGATFTHMLTVFTDWIVPLRIATAAGTKVRPCRFNDLWSLDANWPSSSAVTSRYVAAGGDLIAVYGQGFTPSLNVTYAKAPVTMAAGTDQPATPGEYHQAYVSYAIYRLRQVEGIAVLAGVLPLFKEFLDSAKEYGNFMRTRHIEAGYDTLPIQFALADRSLAARVAGDSTVT